MFWNKRNSHGQIKNTSLHCYSFVQKVSCYRTDRVELLSSFILSKKFILKLKEPYFFVSQEKLLFLYDVLQVRTSLLHYWHQYVPHLKSWNTLQALCATLFRSWGKKIKKCKWHLCSCLVVVIEKQHIWLPQDNHFYWVMEPKYHHCFLPCHCSKTRNSKLPVLVYESFVYCLHLLFVCFPFWNRKQKCDILHRIKNMIETLIALFS